MRTWNARGTMDGAGACARMGSGERMGARASVGSGERMQAGPAIGSGERMQARPAIGSDERMQARPAIGSGERMQASPAIGSGERMQALGAALGFIALLSGCASSTPLRYYTLSQVPPASETMSVTSAAPAIRVGRVRIPGEIDRNELVQRLDATRVNIAEQDRWAAPLDGLIRAALSADLQTRGAAAGRDSSASTRETSPRTQDGPPKTQDTSPRTPDSSPRTGDTSPATQDSAPTTDAAVGRPATLTLDIEEFIGDATCAVTLRASWELRTATDVAVTRNGHESIRVPPSAGTCSIGALPMTMSQALAQLSDRILAASASAR